LILLLWSNSVMLSLEMLPARHGDCLWLEWGDDQNRYRLLIDGGTSGTYQDLCKRFRDLDLAEREFELLIITHIDADHISGVLKLLEEDDTGTRFKEIWFNGWEHLLPDNIEIQGPVQGERLTALLIPQRDKWNKHFNGQRIAIPHEGTLPKIHLPAGLTLTLMSPMREQLMQLMPEWKREVQKAHLDPRHVEPEMIQELPSNIERFGPGDPKIDALAESPFQTDDSRPNGSSIAVLAEYQEKRLLLAADAHVDVLLYAIERLVGPVGKLHLDAFKLSHHGS